MNIPDPDPQHCAVRLRMAVSLLGRQLRSNAQSGGISVAKLSVLGQLHRLGPSSPTELAAREGVKLQSLTRLLAELESDGWLARQVRSSDHRQSLLSLTQKGARRLTAHVQAREAALATVIGATLGADDRAVLLRACTLIDGIAEALQPGSALAAEPAVAASAARPQRS